MSCVAWHKDKFGFEEMAKTNESWEQRHGMKAVVLKGAGGVALDYN